MDAARTLRRVRLEARLSLRALAERAGTSHATLAAYEARRAVPRVDTLDRILRAAGYATDIDVARRADATDVERSAKGEELREALELAALPGGVVVDTDGRSQLRRDGQGRLWWDGTPIDLFLSTTEFHHGVAARVRWEPFAGTDLPFLSCEDLAVFKAFFDRTRDWADLEAMRDAGTLDVAAVAGVLATCLGGDDVRLARLLSL